MKKSISIFIISFLSLSSFSASGIGGRNPGAGAGATTGGDKNRSRGYTLLSEEESRALRQRQENQIYQNQEDSTEMVAKVMVAGSDGDGGGAAGVVAGGDATGSSDGDGGAAAGDASNDESTDESQNNVSTTTAFVKENCEGDTNVESICGIESPEKPNTTTTGTNSKAGHAERAKAQQEYTKSIESMEVKNYPKAPEKGAGTCEEGVMSSQECCQDPTTCMGGAALSTLNSVSTMAAQFGPAAATLAQGFGKDMASLCKDLQYMAAGSATVSLAASQACSTSISSCKSACENDIARACHTYKAAKQKCLTEKVEIESRNPEPTDKQLTLDTEAYTPFETSAKFIGAKIQEFKKGKAGCIANKNLEKDMSQNLGVMANSALASQGCIMQAGFKQQKEACKKSGGNFVDGECIRPEDKCKETGHEWNPETKKCKPRATTQLAEITMQGPNVPGATQAGNKGGTGETAEGAAKDPPKKDNTDDDDDDDGDGETTGNTQAGGGGEEAGAGAPAPSIDLPDDDGEEEFSSNFGESPTQQQGSPKSSGLNYSGFGGGSGFRANYNGNKKRKFREANDNNISMGGGGFAGYGGGGAGDDGMGSYANLGLSKKKLKELETKKGATRNPTSGNMGGAHQNIFERVSKRFQSLCKNKLDCR